MPPIWLYASLKNPALYYKVWSDFNTQLRDLLNDSNISEDEKSERVFMSYLIGKSLGKETDGDLVKRIVCSKGMVYVNPEFKLYFGKMFSDGDKIAIVDSDNVVVPGEPLGRGFLAEIRNTQQADSLVSLIEKYPMSAKIERKDKGTLMKIVPMPIKETK